MGRLLLFLFRYRAFFVFLTLEFFSAWLIIQNNRYQSALYFNSSNSWVASINGFSKGVRDYFALGEINTTLADENAALRNQLEQQQQRLRVLEGMVVKDSVFAKRFDYIPAKVVNNSVERLTNFITVDQGKDADIEIGMAVINHAGVVGKVKAVSKNFSIVTSLLNIDVMVSSELKRTGHFGTVQWGGIDPAVVDFKYLPRHVSPAIGDSIVTSGFNAVFPEGTLIGTIEEFELSDEALFYDIKVKLAQDFRKLSYVTIIRSKLKVEIDSLSEPITEELK